MTRGLDELIAENAAFRREIEIAREAQAITAELVVAQFVTVENILRQLEVAKAKAEEAQRATELRNRFIRLVFGRYLSDEVVESLLESPTGLHLGGEKRKVSVMMTDLRGFTAICERLPAESVVAMLNTYLESMTDVILRHGGTIDEFIGDAILVIFGAPIPREDDALRAVTCAIDMQLAMHGINQCFREAGYPQVEMGIGINTGDVVVGNIGSTRRAKYGIVGHNVNLTSRIESYAVGAQVLISESTLRDCRGLLEIRRALEVMPKGVEAPVTIFEVGGVGGDYGCCLPRAAAASFAELPTPLPAKLAIIENKHAKSEMDDGAIVALAENTARLVCAAELPLYANVKLRIFDEAGGVLCSEVYAKVTGAGNGELVLHFTSLPAEGGALLRSRLREARSGQRSTRESGADGPTGRLSATTP